MIAFTQRQRAALSGAFTIAVACLLFAGCKEETPKPSAPGFYDGPMKPKSSGGSQKMSGTAPQGNQAGAP